MRIPAKAILLSVLLVLLQAQSHSNTYSLNGHTFQYVYGAGASSAANQGDRPDASQTQFVPDSTYTPPATSKPNVVDCPINRVYNNILCECVCILGYYEKDGQCTKFDPLSPVCGRNEVYRDQRCQCDNGFFLIGTICDVCPPYSTYALSTLSCNCAAGYVLVQGECRKKFVPPVQPPVPRVPQCGVNEQLNGGICSCLPNFFLVGGVCTYCVAPNIYDANNGICRPTCAENEQLDLATLTCACIGGFNTINGKCGQCPAFGIYNRFNQVCDCVEGYTFSSGICIPKTSAPRPTPELPVAPRPCQDINAFVVNTQCVCKPSYYLIGGICRQCQIGTFYDPDLAICRLPCLANEVFDIIKGQCDCAQTYFKINGVCTQCSGSATYNPVTQVCECPAGQTLDAAGNCIVGCGVNEVFKDGKCCCIVGYYPVNGVCGLCAWNEIYDQGLGICRIPCDHTRIFDISQKKCVCLPEFFEMADGTCETCVVHSTYDPVTKSCVCNAGYLKNLGLCTPSCNAYEQFVNGKCICREGYYLIGYSCGLCPPTQVYDSVYRICHSPCAKNEVWDPIIRSCRCLPGYYLINQICSQCDPRTQVYNQRTGCCDCISGFKKTSGQGCHGKCVSVCSVNEDYILNRCVCKPGFNLINNFCTKCPSGQFYDIYQRICRIKCGSNQVYNFHSRSCDCAPGFYIVQGICSKCQIDETYN